MSIDSEVERIRQAIAAGYEACQTMGATKPQVQNSDNLADCISSIGGNSTN